MTTTQTEKQNPFITGDPSDFHQEIDKATRERLEQRATYKLITVKSNLKAVERVTVTPRGNGSDWVERDSSGSRVVLWEKDERHPNGEIFVAGDKPVRVAETPKVLEKIWTGFLVVVEDEA